MKDVQPLLLTSVSCPGFASGSLCPEDTGLVDVKPGVFCQLVVAPYTFVQLGHDCSRFSYPGAYLPVQREGPGDGRAEVDEGIHHFKTSV